MRYNGAGFDTAGAARLFSQFQRLITAGEFKEGLALAAAKRGGAIRADAASEGATVYFTLPTEP